MSGAQEPPCKKPCNGAGTSSISQRMSKDPRDEDAGKGAVEQDRPGQTTNVAFSSQLPHRDQNPLLKNNDSDFPEPGQNEEHTGEPSAHNSLQDDAGCEPKSH